MSAAYVLQIVSLRWLARKEPLTNAVGLGSIPGQFQPVLASTLATREGLWTAWFMAWVPLHHAADRRPTSDIF